MQEQVIPLIFLFSITIIFLISEFLIPKTISKYIQYVYLIVLIISQVTIYTIISKNACEGGIGFSNIYQVILPWVIIPILFFSLLKIFPGWKVPFSNTLGWGAVKIYALLSGTILKNLIKGDIYENKSFSEDTVISLLFNHYTNDDDFDSNIKQYVVGNHDEKVKWIFEIKDIVARYIWYTLISLYTLSVSNFQLSRVRC